MRRPPASDLRRRPRLPTTLQGADGVRAAEGLDRDPRLDRHAHPFALREAQGAPPPTSPARPCARIPPSRCPTGRPSGRPIGVPSFLDGPVTPSRVIRVVGQPLDVLTALVAGQPGEEDSRGSSARGRDRRHPLPSHTEFSRQPGDAALAQMALGAGAGSGLRRFRSGLGGLGDPGGEDRKAMPRGAGVWSRAPAGGPRPRPPRTGGRSATPPCAAGRPVPPGMGKLGRDHQRGDGSRLEALRV